MTEVGDSREADAVARAKRGEVAAFELLYKGSADRVFALCLRMSGSREQAAELAHDAFVQAWERLASFRGDSSFGTWMHRLTVNLVLQRQRADRRRDQRESLGDEDDVGADAGPDGGGFTRPVNVEDRIDLERAIATLSPNARTVFVLHDIEGYRHDEIADRMQLAPGTVRAHLHRARHHLMRLLHR